MDGTSLRPGGYLQQKIPKQDQGLEDPDREPINSVQLEIEGLKLYLPLWDAYNFKGMCLLYNLERN